ncbi:MPN domain-containing protein [Halotydeus destructor]|nr:MPN domain-containing protein [Halotydeus destructor]
MSSQGDNRSDHDDKDDHDDSEDVCDSEPTAGPSAYADCGTVSQVGRKPATGQTCSLKTLIDDGVLDAGDNVLTMEYMSAKFFGDLLLNGTIRWTETKQLFSTPSSWVNHCKKVVNPENSGKTGSAWSTIRYNGKRLDSYKLRWYRKQKKIVTGASTNEISSATSNPKITSQELPLSNNIFKDLQQLTLQAGNVITDDPATLRERNIIEHADLAPKTNPDQNLNVMVKCEPFSVLERLQPFNITLSTNALLLIDFHCHLTSGEVVGYLGGTWDFATHNLAILQSFPCRSRLADKEKGSTIEEEIRQNLDQRHLSLVGWYHSHPRSAPQPTVKDVESQLEYQIAMKGENDSSYVPCVGLICSPYDAYNKGSQSTYQTYWVMPPPEYRPYEFGKPMHMTYSITRDSFLTQDLLLEMRLLAHFYVEGPDAIKFAEEFKENKSALTSYWEKLQESLAPNLPRDLQVTDGQSLQAAQVQQQALTHFWAFLKGLLIQQ